MNSTVYVPSWHVLTITASADAVGIVSLVTHPGIDAVGVVTVAGADLTIGPYVTDELVAVDLTGGSCSYSVAKYDIASLAANLAVFEAARPVLDLMGDGVPVDYTDGDPVATGEGIAPIGSRYTDYTNGKLYLNGGTQAQPVWKLVTSA